MKNNQQRFFAQLKRELGEGCDPKAPQGQWPPEYKTAVLRTMAKSPMLFPIANVAKFFQVSQSTIKRWLS